MTQPNTPPPSAREDIAAGLAETAGHRTSDAKRAQRTSDAFRLNADYERLLQMRRDDPARFEKLGSTTAIATALYASQREVYAAVTEGDQA